MKEYAHVCPSCREIYGQRNPPEAPPCETCRVGLLEENADAAMIYQLTRGQVITLGEHVVDINHLAIWQAIDRYKIADPLQCFELVSKVFHHFLKLEREKQG